MQAAGQRRHGATIWYSLALAIVLHAIVILALCFVPEPEPPIPLPEESVSVEIVYLPTVAAGTTKPRSGASQVGEAVAQEAAPERAVPAATLPDVQPATQAKRFFSAAILADARSKQALKGLSQLAADERIIQICNLEAMEQVHRWRVDFKPDFLVAYAMADIRLAGTNLRADGAAFRSNDRWYNIKFDCEAAPDIKSVVAFEFQVGDEIPESEWEAHFLSAGTRAR
ncbi:hypothetical protein D9M68_143900 [compost metagenome]